MPCTRLNFQVCKINGVRKTNRCLDHVEQQIEYVELHIKKNRSSGWQTVKVNYQTRTIII